MRGGKKTGLRPPAARQCVIRKSVVIIELGHGKKVCGNASRASFTNGSIAGSGSGNAPPFQPVSCMFGNIFIVAYEKASLPRPDTVFSSSSFFPLPSRVRALNFFKRACAAASTTAAAFLCLTDERKLKKISRDRTNLRMRDLLIGHSLERIIKLYEF